MAKKKGFVRVEVDRCKGCELCLAACPLDCLEMSPELNRLGYHPVVFLDDRGCTGCGVCYYACPEPAALSVWLREEVA